MKKLILAITLAAVTGCTATPRTPSQVVNVDVPRQELATRLYNLEATCWRTGKLAHLAGITFSKAEGDGYTAIRANRAIQSPGTKTELVQIKIKDHGKGSAVEVYQSSSDWMDAAQHMKDLNAWLNGDYTCHPL